MNRFLELRTACGLTQVEVARRGRVAPSTVSTFETGKVSASKNVCAALAKGMGFTLKTLAAYLRGDVSLDVALKTRGDAAPSSRNRPLWKRSSPDSRLRQLREACGLSQTALARAGGIGPTIICKVEGGKHSGESTGVRTAVAKGLGLSVDAVTAFLDGAVDLETTLRGRTPAAGQIVLAPPPVVAPLPTVAATGMSMDATGACDGAADDAAPSVISATFVVNAAGAGLRLPDGRIMSAADALYAHRVLGGGIAASLEVLRRAPRP